MGKQSIPWAVALTGVLYFGMLGYWQYDAFETALGFGGNASQNAVDGAIFGFTMGVAYVAYVMLCFTKDLPEGMKEIPIIGRYGKMLGWLAFLVVAVWYCRPNSIGDGSHQDLVGYLLVGVILLGFGAAAALTSFMYSGEKSSRLYALRRFVDTYPTITKPDRHVRFNEKLWTTTLVLIIYFAMTNVMLWGLSGQALDLFSGFRSIMAGASGTIMHLGIGPIVTGSLSCNYSLVLRLFA